MTLNAFGYVFKYLTHSKRLKKVLKMLYYENARMIQLKII